MLPYVSFFSYVNDQPIKSNSWNPPNMIRSNLIILHTRLPITIQMKDKSHVTIIFYNWHKRRCNFCSNAFLYQPFFFPYMYFWWLISTFLNWLSHMCYRIWKMKKYINNKLWPKVWTEATFQCFFLKLQKSFT